jgi:hypothetical protein
MACAAEACNADAASMALPVNGTAVHGDFATAPAAQ